MLLNRLLDLSIVPTDCRLICCRCLKFYSTCRKSKQKCVGVYLNFVG